MSISECCGWMGRLFGHKFKSFLVEWNGPSVDQIKAAFAELPHSLLLPAAREVILPVLRSEKYSVLCKRCGAKGESMDAYQMADPR